MDDETARKAPARPEPQTTTARDPEPHARSGADPTTTPPSAAPSEQFYARENRKD